MIRECTFISRILILTKANKTGQNRTYDYTFQEYHLSTFIGLNTADVGKIQMYCNIYTLVYY